jgi:hypothetical protein
MEPVVGVQVYQLPFMFSVRDASIGLPQIFFQMRE